MTDSERDYCHIDDDADSRHRRIGNIVHGGDGRNDDMQHKQSDGRWGREHQNMNYSHCHCQR